MTNHKAQSSKHRIHRSLITLIMTAVLSSCAVAPAATGKPDEAYVKEAWAYFKSKCDTEAGEKIYKTFTGVKSVLVVKPLPPATEKDLYDQFWMGDPYSNATPYDKRGDDAARRLANDSRSSEGIIQRALEFVEIKIESGNGYVRIHKAKSNDENSAREQVNLPVSKFGVIWEDISRPEDRKYWVAASRLRVINLVDNQTVAERIGFLIEAGFGRTTGQRRPWLTSRGPGTTCPSVEGDYTDQRFISRVFELNKGN